MSRSLLTFLLLAGCAADVPRSDVLAMGELSAGTQGTGRAESSSSSGGLDLPPDLPPELLDVGAADGPIGIFPCDALDVLFVIDNSGSMQDEQEALVASVPGFIERLSTLGVGVAGGMHVGVTTVDSNKNNEAPCNIMGAMNEAQRPEGEQPTPCGPYAEGHSYLTEADDLWAPETFACMAQPGTLGSGSEKPIAATIEALDAYLNSEGQCNEGFHRLGWTTGDAWEERASLVVVIITDEDAQGGGTPQAWFNHLEWIRGGSLVDTSFLFLVSLAHCDSQPAPKLRAFAQLLDDEGIASSVGAVCEPDYAPFFDEAVELIVGNCGETWLPEG